jgi:hypothetical protein
MLLRCSEQASIQPVRLAKQRAVSQSTYGRQSTCGNRDALQAHSLPMVQTALRAALLALKSYKTLLTVHVQLHQASARAVSTTVYCYNMSRYWQQL